MSLKSVVQTSRPPFLVLTPSCALLGLSVHWHALPDVQWLLLIAVFTGALLAHISVNMFNEYFDFKSGLDLKTIRTAFSGGSGALPADPEAVDATLIIAITALVLTCLIGIYLMTECGLLILPLGLVGVFLVFFYTKWINLQPWLCLVSPGLGFGLLMVLGTDFVMTGQYSVLALVLSLVPFLLTNNLLLLNQYPDVEADESIGRRTFPIVYGIDRSNTVYALSSIAAYLVIAALILLNVIPQVSAVALLPAVLSAYACLGAINNGEFIAEHPSYMGANVGAAVLTPLLLALSILFG